MRDTILPGVRPLRCLNILTVITGAFAGGGAFVASERPAMACNSEPYIGTVCTFAFDFCPVNYAPADGRLMQISQYQALFALIGTIYGGNATSNFALPDLRSRSAVGVGAGTGLATPTPIGAPIGQQSTTLTLQQLPPHTHPATFAGTGGGNQPVSIPAQTGSLTAVPTLKAKQVAGVSTIANGSYLGQGGGGGSAASIYVDPASTAQTADLGGLTVELQGTPGSPALNFNVNSGITGGTVTVLPNTGGPQPFSTQSPGLGLTQCIAINGLFPSRP